MRLLDIPVRGQSMNPPRPPSSRQSRDTRRASLPPGPILRLGFAHLLSQGGLVAPPSHQVLERVDDLSDEDVQAKLEIDDTKEECLRMSVVAEMIAREPYFGLLLTSIGHRSKWYVKPCCNACVRRLVHQPLPVARCPRLPALHTGRPFGG
jgi:hypothetical protein